MDKNNLVTGIVFICIGAFALILPSLGLLSPGESFDWRIAPVTIVIGFAFLIMAAISKDETVTIPQPIQPQPMQQQQQQQPPQQLVRTLVICPKCGIRIPVEMKFCPECGANLTPGKPQPS
jgi:hypothetical protein